MNNDKLQRSVIEITKILISLTEQIDLLVKESKKNDYINRLDRIRPQNHIIIPKLISSNNLLDLHKIIIPKVPSDLSFEIEDVKDVIIEDVIRKQFINNEGFIKFRKDFINQLSNIKNKEWLNKGNWNTTHMIIENPLSSFDKTFGKKIKNIYVDLNICDNIYDCFDIRSLIEADTNFHTTPVQQIKLIYNSNLSKVMHFVIDPPTDKKKLIQFETEIKQLVTFIEKNIHNKFKPIIIEGNKLVLQKYIYNNSTITKNILFKYQVDDYSYEFIKTLIRDKLVEGDYSKYLLNNYINDLKNKCPDILVDIIYEQFKNLIDLDDEKVQDFFKENLDIFLENTNEELKILIRNAQINFNKRTYKSDKVDVLSYVDIVEGYRMMGHDHNDKNLEYEELDVDSCTIQKLIKLGKLYDCSKKYNINVKILNQLIEPLEQLDQMIGLADIKQQIIDQIIFFLQDLEGVNTDMLHTVIAGPPGVGKTEIGKIIANIYLKMGFLKKDTFKIARRSDLIGEYLGHTAVKTQKVVDSCEGGVLFIDEAYSLGNAENKDSFSKECLDTLTMNLSENKSKFVCIIAGYEKALNTCFFSYNEGLNRRFPFRYSIEGYTSNELVLIFEKQVAELGWTLEEGDGISKLFDKNIKLFPFFGGDVEKLLLSCKIHHSKRVFGQVLLKGKLSFVDIEKGFLILGTQNKNDDDKSMHNSMYI